MPSALFSGIATVFPVGVRKAATFASVSIVIDPGTTDAFRRTSTAGLFGVPPSQTASLVLPETFHCALRIGRELIARRRQRDR